MKNIDDTNFEWVILNGVVTDQSMPLPNPYSTSEAVINDCGNVVVLYKHHVFVVQNKS